MDKQTAKAINDVSKKLNEVERKLETFLMLQHENNKADIDYIALMTDVDLEEDEEEGEIDA